MGKHSEYKGVYLNGNRYTGKPWKARVVQSKRNLNENWQADFDTEREAAIAVDRKRIELGLDPVNILKRK